MVRLLAYAARLGVFMIVVWAMTILSCTSNDQVVPLSKKITPDPYEKFITDHGYQGALAESIMDASGLVPEEMLFYYDTYWPVETTSFERLRYADGQEGYRARALVFAYQGSVALSYNKTLPAHGFGSIELRKINTTHIITATSDCCDVFLAIYYCGTNRTCVFMQSTMVES